MTTVFHKKVRTQFDELAFDYDNIKKRNLYYFNNLKKIFENRITERNSKIIEIGCGTGGILKTLRPEVGVGIDISPEMIKIARSRYPYYSFYCQNLENLDIKEEFDYVILPDIIEYVNDLDRAFSNLRILCKESTTVIITSPNPLWFFLLYRAEKLNLKMKDRLRRERSKHEVILAAKKQRFKVLEYSTRLLIPKKILFSDYINRKFYKLPILRQLGLIQVFVLKVDINVEK